MDNTAQRPSFDTELHQRTNQFLRDTLTAIPELDGLAVTFSYGHLITDLPYAMVQGQHGALQTPTELVHMSQQLLRTLNFQLQKAGQYLQQVDKVMAERAKELKDLQDQIDAARNTLAADGNDPSS